MSDPCICRTCQAEIKPLDEWRWRHAGTPHSHKVHRECPAPLIKGLHVEYVDPAAEPSNIADYRTESAVPGN